MSGTIGQGTLNRLRASVTFPLFPQLNVTAPYLGRRAISLTFTGKSTVRLDAMTGQVTSPEPYLGVVMTLYLLKSQAFANAWKIQQELLTLIGPCVVRPDAATMQPYAFANASIDATNPLDFSGSTPDFPVEIGATYYINAGLYP